MKRVLLIEDDRALAQSMAMACVANGIAVRLAETLCEGVRYLMEGPASAVLVDASLMRLSGTDRVRLFDTVAPGVPVVALVARGTAVEETVKLELLGFQVMQKPFDIRDLLAKLDVPVRMRHARPGSGGRRGHLRIASPAAG